MYMEMRKQYLNFFFHTVTFHVYSCVRCYELLWGKLMNTDALSLKPKLHGQFIFSSQADRLKESVQKTGHVITICLLRLNEPNARIQECVLWTLVPHGLD